MTKLEKAIQRDINKAKLFIIKAHGRRPTLCREIGIGVHWSAAFIQDRIDDPSFSKIVRILDFIDKGKKS